MLRETGILDILARPTIWHFSTVLMVIYILTSEQAIRICHPMGPTVIQYDSHEPVIDFHLLAEVHFDEWLRFQRRLVYDAASSNGLRGVIVLCEHPRTITIGKSGSREHLLWTHDEIERRELTVRWVNRGGSCVYHCPGQLAIYAIFPLGRLGWSGHEFRQRFLDGIEAALTELTFRVRTEGDAIWGNSGLLVAPGIRIHDQISSHGAFLNVHPDLSEVRQVKTFTHGQSDSRPESMSSLLAERRLPVKMSRVRSAIISALAERLECSRHLIHSGHPWLAKGNCLEPVSRAG